MMPNMMPNMMHTGAATASEESVVVETKPESQGQEAGLVSLSGCRMSRTNISTKSSRNSDRMTTNDGKLDNHKQSRTWLSSWARRADTAARGKLSPPFPG